MKELNTMQAQQISGATIRFPGLSLTVPRGALSNQAYGQIDNCIQNVINQVLALDVTQAEWEMYVENIEFASVKFS